MPQRPNLVFVFSDQQRHDTLACYGNKWIQTPHLNELADQSFVFEAAYVAQPVCTPARATIMTGLYPHTAGPIVNKMNLPTDVSTIAEMVSEDYHRGYFGKWHLGNDVIAQHGFDEWVSTEDGHRPQYTHHEHLDTMSDYHRHLVSHGFEPDIEAKDGTMLFSANRRAELPEEFQMASYLGDQAASFIQRNSDQPFILYVSTFEPHSPNKGPLDDMYDPEELPVGPAFLKKPEGASLLNRIRSDYYLKYMGDSDGFNADNYMTSYASAFNDITTEAGWKRLRARYFANITLVDRMVGKITSALDNAGIAEETVVVFTSEHGDHMGDHGLLEKRSFYEESSRVPLLMRVPWLSESQRMIEGSVSHIDLVPTLLELLGEPMPDRLQGKSLLPVLKNEDSLDDGEVVIQWNGISPEMEDRGLGTAQINRLLALPWRSIIHDRWKLNLCAGDQCELFDLRKDPHEMNNLFNNPDHRDRIRELAARLRIWQVRTGDTAPLPDV